jgi:hypothetical protein
MGFLNMLKGRRKITACSQCQKETEDLPISKKFDDIEYRFCSKDCSRKYRIERKKQKKKPAQAPSTGLPW